MVRKSASLAIGLPHSGHSGGSERQRVVEHGVEHVDEGHLGDQPGEELRRQIGDGADEKAAGRAAPADDPARRGEAFGGEIARRRR